MAVQNVQLGRQSGVRRLTVRLAALLCGFLLVAGACGSSDETADSDDASPEADAAPAGGGEEVDNQFGGTLAEGEFGESYLPDPELVEQSLGGAASLPDDPMERNIALAGISRASEEVDEDKALECWQNNGCETGTGGELTVGLADGFGGNVARQLFKMEFILQALTYPEIGQIIYTDANLDTQKAISDVRSMVAQDVDVIVSYPDAGEALVPAYQAATTEGAQVVLWANADVGEPGTDYLTFSGSDQCAIGQAYATVINEELPEGGTLALLGGTPGNTQSPAWQECQLEMLNPDIEVVATADTEWTRESALEATSGIISQYPDVDAWSYDYGDAFVGVLRAYEAAQLPFDFVATVSSDENSMLCAWKELDEPNLRIHHYVALFTQGRVALTAAMMQLNGADIPNEIIFGTALKLVDENSCRDDIPDDGSPSSLISGELQSRMYPE